MYFFFILGEIVINVSRTNERSERPYLMMSVTKLCVDIALMAFGPALQVSVKGVRLSDKFHHSTSGQYLEVICSDPKEDVLNLLYRKVFYNQALQALNSAILASFNKIWIS